MRRRSLIQTFGLSAVGFAATCALPAVAQLREADVKRVTVAAASDLKFALTDLVAQFERESQHRFAVNLGSSGNFAQQIRNGLPVDLFLSADEEYVFQLADVGLTRDRGALYAIGRIALYVPTKSLLRLDSELRGLMEQWAGVTKFAIANPEHAPYGRAAKQALQQLGLWDRVSSKLVMGENISQATQFVATGAAQAGITALSLAVAPEIASLGKHVVLPERLHAPLRQRMVLLKNASPGAWAFYDFLQSSAAKTVLARYGFR